MTSETPIAIMVRNIHRQAIETVYIGPTNLHDARVKATAAAGSVTLPWDYDISSDENHAAAVRALADKYGWGGNWVGGVIAAGCRVFVQVDEK